MLPEKKLNEGFVVLFGVLLKKQTLSCYTRASIYQWIHSSLPHSICRQRPMHHVLNQTNSAQIF